MIGQKNLLNRIDSYTTDTFPRSIILIGRKGMGKHETAKYIANKIGFPLVDFHELSARLVKTGSIYSPEAVRSTVDQIYTTVSPAVYTIEPKFFKREITQYTLLKFLEEPLKNAYLIILVEDKADVLPTIFNRCVTFEMEAYSKDELSTFISTKDGMDTILDFASTPGQVKAMNSVDMPGLISLCDTIATKLSKANYANALSIASKLNYGSDPDKFDYRIFLDYLGFTLFHKYLSENNKTILNMYLLLADEVKKLSDGNKKGIKGSDKTQEVDIDTSYDKLAFMEHLITLLWKESKNEH